MKKLLMLLVAAMALGGNAFAADDYYEVNTAPDARHAAFRPNEVIVKFKTEGPVRVKAKSNGSLSTSGVKTVDDVLASYSIKHARQLMPLTGGLSMPRRVKAHNGSEVEIKDLSKLYCLKAEADIDVRKLADELAALPEVEFAEPNYLVYVNSTPNDPLYSQQWGVPAVKADALWDKPLLSDKRPVIAILDTGVDIAHPDLQANIWTNPEESTGSGGYDDDGNGFVDDVCGWDFVNETGIMQDYNGHGTHCAGIAAAVGNNGIGICGANPDALIMPLTVMQSDGTGDIATIVRGIDYATAKGADVLSMSFGTYAHTIAMEQALARAYSKAVLVAAAGNDGHDMDGHHCFCDAPMFPAAYTFVLGVQASTPGGGLAGFSNWDCNGPITSSFGEEELYNYELTAPGTNIMSTYPGGRYKALNGTSMACPLVAGAVSRLISAKEYPTKELLFGDLIHSAGANVDFEACYAITDADRKPELSIVSWRIEDEKDHDGRYDAGETIKFYPIIRNSYGLAENILVWMELGELEGKVVEMSRAMADFSKPLSSYAKAETAEPIVFKIKDDVADGRHIRLVLYAQCDGMDEPARHEFIIEAENGVEIGGMIDHDMTLEADVYYIVTSTLAIPKGVTLTIAPGAVLSFKDNSGMVCEGSVIANGTPDKMITFKPARLEQGTAERISLPFGEDVNYAIFDGFNGTKIHGTFKNCIFRNFGLPEDGFQVELENCVIEDNIYVGWAGFDKWFWDGYASKTNFVNNIWKYNPEYMSHSYWGRYYNRANNLIGNIDGNNPIVLANFWLSDAINVYQEKERPNYYGSSREDIVRRGVFDIECGWKYSKFDFSTMLAQPNPKAHGVVWKILVDGKDAQDEYEDMLPLGVGRHKFEVWYSQVVDQTETPFMAMGVRPPYTQTAIGEDGSWRTETIKYFRWGNSLPDYVSLKDFHIHDISYPWKFDMPNGYYNSAPDREGFSGNSYYLWEKPKFKINQDLFPVKNGEYIFRLKVNTNVVFEDQKGVYLYANDNKVYVNSIGINVYEVPVTVTNHELSVGIAQDEALDNEICFGDPELILVTEYPYEGEDLEVSVYTAYLDITGGMAIDGLNRIYVSGCKDLEGFDIPRENRRFNVEVAAAGSMSTGFMAEPGVGKVTLTWEDQDENVDDILGYNMYRASEETRVEYEWGTNPDTGNWEQLEKYVTYQDTIRVNQRLIDETAFVDYDVTPGKNYNYFYKILRTNMAENSPSKVVSVTPLTASKGDANGSAAVDVADVVTEVSYITGGNPQPFIYEAADVNGDNEINVLDVVGTIRIILNPQAASAAQTEGTVRYWVSDGVLYVDSDVALGGVQFSFEADHSNSTFTTLEALAGFETAGAWNGDVYTFLAYSMSGRTLLPGTYAIMRIDGGAASVVGATCSDTLGGNVVTMDAGLSGVALAEMAQMRLPNPNPFTDAVSIPFVVGTGGSHKVELRFTDLSGRTVGRHSATYDYGTHSYTWRPAVGRGVYLATLIIDGKTVQTAKIIKL